MRISPFQEAVLSVPEEYNLFLGGSRAGGKTMAALFCAMRHIDKYKEDATVLIVRRTLKALDDFALEVSTFAAQNLPGSNYNKTERTLYWQGARIILASIERESDYHSKFQGRNFTLLIVDEATAYTSERIIRLLRSNLRAPEGVITRTIYCCNPGGPLHGLMFKNHVKDRQSYVPYTLDLEDDEKEEWVSIASGIVDNPFIDQTRARRRILEACRGNEILKRQWLYGEWAEGSGLLFPHFDPDVHVLDVPAIMDGNKFRAQGAIDWGISSPSVGLLGGIVKRDLEGMPRHSVIVWGEATDAIFEDDDLSKSSEWTVDRLGERFSNLAIDHGASKPNIVVDSARGIQGDTVLKMLTDSGEFWNVALPKKGRRGEGWADINSRLLAAKEKDQHRPHLYIASSCKYLLATLPRATRDERDPDDWADIKSCPDHGGDALRYLLAEARLLQAKVGRIIGNY